MRITCPSCLAQYEIEAALLTADGREVQCSSCSHIWFQHASAEKMAAPAPDAEPPESRDSAGSQASDAPPAIPEPDAPEPETDTGLPAETALKPRSRALDPAVMDVLREEAEFEASQRKREAEGLQSQPELGLLSGAPWPVAGADADDDQPPRPSQAGGTGAAFPDIEDISATLEPVSERRSNGDFQLPQTSRERQRSFLRGFVVPPVLALLMVGLYLAAPTLGTAVPVTAPAMSGYVGLIDSARAGVQAMLLGR
ncbi:zinc-ribbon domain-containing protein [Roseinatronobacter alkalisoli]|uniref:Zinc-ribbon domain-containing protein n=1 Tax=Roseinatronobacter alkalisoli TaxID=3028235 RepID=A0ABT5TC71_9RHOB|nr:zinc-ribbon domain-containing protein [Roseinatronobacter sp. HJB301]MDD7971523.1 zinc-ribbon domain-containing protein [Roseinatronobacter sp. HJB301]